MILREAGVYRRPRKTLGVIRKGDELSYLQTLHPYLLFDAQTSMIGTLENPTLDLDPSKPDTLNVITATRAGAATYTDASGVVKSASPNTTRIDHVDGVPMILVEPSATNLFKNSVQLEASPNVSTLVTTTEEVETFKGQKVFRITDTAASGEHRLYVNAASSTATAHIVHFYAKPLTCSKIGITYPTAGDAAVAWNLSSGATLGSSIGSATAHTIEDAGDGWFKVSMTYDRPTVSPTGHNIHSLPDSATSISNRNYTGSGDLSFLMTTPQLETGTVATSYIPTSGSTVTRAADDLQIERDSTNLFVHSEDFSNAAWSKVDTTVLDGQADPFGTTNAQKLTSTGANSSASQTFTVTSGTTYTLSFYLKTASGSVDTVIGLGSPGFPQNEGEGGRYKDITVTDEWQRFTLTSTADATASTGISFGGFNGFSTGEEVFIYGAQVETGTATTYIPTSGAVASRTTFADFYNQSEGTFYIEGVPQNLTDDTIYWMDMSPSNERIAIYDGASYNVRYFVENTESASAAYYPPNQLARLAISCKSNAQELSVNGGTSVTLTKSSLPSPTSLHIGSRYSLGDHLNGHIKRLIYWPYHSDSL